MRSRISDLISCLFAAVLVLGATGCSDGSSSASKDVKSRIEAAVAGIAAASGDAPVVDVRIHLDGTSYFNVVKDGSLTTWFWYPDDSSATELGPQEPQLEFRTGVQVGDAQITQWANQIENGFSEECKGVMLTGTLTPAAQWLTHSMCFDVDEDYDSTDWRERKTYLDGKPFEFTYPGADLSKMNALTDELAQVLGSDEALVIGYGKPVIAGDEPVSVTVHMPSRATLDGQSCDPEFALSLHTAGSGSKPSPSSTKLKCRSQADDTGLQPFHFGSVNWEKVYQSAPQFQQDELFFEIDSPSTPDQPLLRQIGALPVEVGNDR